MAVQMDRLTSLSALPNVRLGIIALDTYVPDGALNTFTIYDERLTSAETFGFYNHAYSMTGIILSR